MRWFHTVRHLRTEQVWAFRPKLRTQVEVLPVLPVRVPQEPWQTAIARECSWLGDNRVRLLNQEREVAAWDSPAWPRLWAYTLNYCDGANAQQIQAWIDGNVPGKGVGWEPYPTSRRIVNWLKFALAGGVLSSQAVASLATQAEHLYRHVEHRVSANHVLANAKALVFAGTFFEGSDAERWLNHGRQILERELGEEVLCDGGHFERSPMYHNLVLEDLLDLVNLASSYQMPFPNVVKGAEAMLGWLREILHPDGEIPFFNDATFGEAACAAELFDYAARLGVSSRASALHDSGYIRLEENGTVVLFDAGMIGPDHQPGHAHADTLSFEMSRNGHRVLVNSGTSTYERGPQRDWERGSAAHNTVRVDEEDQSEIWHSFRVGRRAHPFDVKTDHHRFAEAAHDGYQRLPGNVIHRRRLELNGDGLLVTDKLEGRGIHKVELFFHIHPGARADIKLDGALSRSVTTTSYHPGFNLSVPKTTVVGQYHGRLPVRFTSQISAE